MCAYPHRSCLRIMAIMVLLLVIVLSSSPNGVVLANGDEPALPKEDKDLKEAGTNRYVATTGVDAGDCSNSASPCETVAYAVSESFGGDTIYIANGTYPNTHVIVSVKLNFVGSGMNTTILDGGGTARVFTLYDEVNISDMTIQNGVNAGAVGGGIANYDILHIERTAILNNIAFNGGGIYSEGQLTLKDVFLKDNTANITNGYGGGLYFYISMAVLSIADTTFTDNSAHWGGGLRTWSDYGYLTNVTISGNTAKDVGAGLYNDGNCEVKNATIVDNTLSIGTTGSGVYNAGYISFLNTIIANNPVNNCSNDATWVSNGYNIDSGNTCLFASTGDQTNALPLHLPLADNGGYTQTHAIPLGSPALDAGKNSGCPSTDQRGKPRPMDGDGDGTATCDVGAYERQSGSTTTITSDSPDPSLHKKTVAVSISVSGSGATPTGTVNITGTNSNCSITLNSGSGSCNVKWNTAGAKTIIANYLGDTYYLPSQDTEAHTVNWDIKTKKFNSTAANDGWILEKSETSETSGSLNADDTTLRVGNDAKDRQYRSVLDFATGALPDNAVLTSVIMKVKKAGVSGTNPFNTHGNLLVDLKKGVFGSGAALQVSDFQASASKLVVGTIPNSPVSGWYALTLAKANYSYINKIGNTQFRLRLAKGDNDDMGADFFKFYSGNNATARPYLEVKYYVP